MATIKAIEARSVHQIQSGQVIVDLCSVVKELVENSLDAGATSIDIRFKNNGLDLIEVQDNGSGITPENYETIALKHYTSKLSTFDDLSSLQTFGFRGEALSSLCALSDFHITTAQAKQAPKATRLEFETSGKLKKSSVVAGQKGTTASVANLFQKLPVRRRELEKNIKREYGKVIGLLHAYACVSTRVRFNAKNQTTKDRNAVVFSTNSNPTTKENIANVYGAKTLLALIPLNLELEFQPSTIGRRTAGQESEESNKILVQGHISRPIFGEGRQTPDRQMFFVNSRPCGIPQITKAFNEVYKSFNVSQSPFIFADFQMDTNAYDVNVSPDKRTILLHDSAALIQSLKTSLTELFDEQDQTVPQSEVSRTQSSIKQHVRDDTSSETPSKRPSIPITREPASDGPENEPNSGDEEMVEDDDRSRRKIFNLVHGMKASPNTQGATEKGVPGTDEATSPSHEPDTTEGVTEAVGTEREQSPPSQAARPDRSPSVAGRNSRLDDNMTEAVGANDSEKASSQPDNTQEDTPNIVQNAFDRMRPTRPKPELATITIGNKTITSMVGSGAPAKRSADSAGSFSTPSRPKRRIHIPSSKNNRFSQSLRGFAAPGTRAESQSDGASENENEEPQDESGESGVDEPEQSSPEPERDYRSKRSEPIEDIERHQTRTEENEMEVDEASDDSDESYVDDEGKKNSDEAKVQQLIREAEEASAVPSEHNIARANKMSAVSGRKDSTVQLMGTIDGSLARIEAQMKTWRDNLKSLSNLHPGTGEDEENALSEEPPETRLSLTVSKDDFAKMRIVGQFNLGFILATRSHDGATKKDAEDELFIIDQHASDEKYNFERLQAETVVQNQRLVQPKTLDLTAVEEEVIIENLPTLERNGFVVEIDTSGDEPIGRRCKLISLPLSKEVVFNIRDLEELVVLLSESPPQLDSSDAYVPRPSKVRKMFAMRACRSSIMVGKTLTSAQMEKVVRHMGTIDKPWNCPHGRPTMRHLMSLGQWSEWDENGDEAGFAEGGDDGWDAWRQFLGQEEDGEDEEESEEDEEGDEEGNAEEDIEEEL
ncbi:hypothetical protein FQN54_004066 [Arachnomyces sp. PD_36]|nr:hypothetical protein FQN54_004066 [Arachnomyces sp. PD_36]